MSQATGTASRARAGSWVRQDSGYKAFRPAPLPPSPPLRLATELMGLLSEANIALGRLDGIASTLPNPDLFVAMYVRHEAVLSSQIEGTQSTLEDVLAHEAGGADQPPDVGEVVNYVAAMNHGLARLADFPLSLRLIREIHEKLMAGVRGGDRSPGEFRRTQNWIGPAGCTLRDAAFVPPAPADMLDALHAFEAFLHQRNDLPVLVVCGLAHAQFETIHPFLDGNGRVGRLLITFLLCERQVLQLPLLYLSLYLKTHRSEYYDRLTAIRERGDWEGWLAFFLRGVSDVSRSAGTTARATLELREADRGRLAGNGSALALHDHLFRRPIVTVRLAERLLGCSYGTASSAVRRLAELGILEETTGGRRNRRFRYRAYLRLFEGLSQRSQQATSRAI